MGYALFASTKILYTNRVNTLQMRLTEIAEKRLSIAEFMGNISDGAVTAEELASDPTNFGNYSEFLQGAQSYKDTPDENGGAKDSIAQIGTAATDKSQDPQYLAEIAQMLNSKVDEEYAKQYNKKLAILDNQLELEQKKIETQLTAAEKQLEAVEQAEGQAINRATPKYNGVG